MMKGKMNRKENDSRTSHRSNKDVVREDSLVVKGQTKGQSGDQYSND
jgi:hypothetical protein